MGNLSAHDRFVHLYINGLYWGVYDVSERIGNSFMEAYYGGEDIEYDVINHNGLADGEKTAFDRMLSLAQNGNFDQLQSEELLVVENYIDYLLLNFYIGNSDWGNNNWYASRNRLTANGGFRFYSWDAENCFFTGLNYNLVSGGGRFGNSTLWKILYGSDGNSGLVKNEEFRLLFADRVQKHFFNNGALSPTQTALLYNEISNEIDKARILESARWGSYRRDVLPGDGKSPLYSRNEHWLPKINDFIKNYFPKRTDIVYNQLYDAGILPDIKAPAYSHSGGDLDSPIDLSINSADGSIYYTVDGSDPRVKGSGAISTTASMYMNPIQINSTCTIKSRARKGNVWSALSVLSFHKKISDATAAPLEEAVAVYCQNNTLNIVNAKQGEISVEIYSIDGKCIMNKTLSTTSNRAHLELSGISQGIYIYRIAVHGKFHSGKFIKSM